MESIREYPQTQQRRGTLRRAVAEMEAFSRMHPEALVADDAGQVHMFRIGPYSDHPAALAAARTMRHWARRDFPGEIEAFVKHWGGRPYVAARYVPPRTLSVVPDAS